VVKLLLIENGAADSFGFLLEPPEIGAAASQIVRVGGLEQALQSLRGEAFDVILLCLSSPCGDDVDAVKLMRLQAPAVPIVVVMAGDEDQAAVDLVHAGARDCLIAAETDERRLIRSIRYAIERRRARGAPVRYRNQAAINMIASTVGQSLQLEEFLEITVAKVIEVTGCEMAHIRLRNPQTGEITLAAHRGLTPEQVDALLQRQTSTGKLQQVFDGSEVIVAQAAIPVMVDGKVAQGEKCLVVWIPLKAKGAAVGVLNVATAQKEKFSEREVELLKAIGNVIGVGLDNARLFTETRRQLTRIEALREISVAVASSLNLSRVLNILIERIAAMLPYSAVTLRLFDKASGELRPATSWNIDDESWKSSGSNSTGPGLSAIVFETKQPLAIRRFLDDPRGRRPDVFRTQGLVSYLGLPMIANGEVVGVLSIYTKFEHEFPDEEIRFLTALANQAGMALHNSQLYEQLSEQAAQLARSNNVKDEFLSVMSHEFRTPLNIILGYCGLMRDGSLGAVNDAQVQALAKITQRSHALLAMLSAILEVTRIETENVPVLRERCDLGDFFARFHSSHDNRLSKDVVLEWRPPDSAVAVNTDLSKLNSILEQLLANAIQFTDSGKITIAMTRADETSFRLSVSDTGIGIPDESLGIIFEKFTQLDSSSTREHEGIGLGLYLVRRLVELLGGSVSVESEVGAGSNFAVILPTDSQARSTLAER
jgi:signal transduction histidine kinase/DNA-binding NarL/FixJ family response regulator